MTLRKRLTLWSVAMSTLVIILLGLIVFIVMLSAMIAGIDTNLEDIIHQVTASTKVITIQHPDGSSHIKIDLPELDFFHIPGIGVQVWELDRGEWVLADATENLAGYKDSLDPEALGNHTPQVYKNINHTGADWRVHTSPITDSQGNFVGNIQVVGSLEMVNHTSWTLFFIMLGSCFLTIIGSSMMSMLMAKRIVQPIEDITGAAARIAETKDLATRLVWHGPMDEIGKLASVFNHMMTRLEHLFKVQQRFVADVSHELRTPLTGISGNLQLIKRYGTSEESLIAMTAETERMSRLVDDLLLLARADYGGLKVDMMVVELDSIIMDIFQQGRG
ncbi:MAG TPA: histidine kinase dimerization/phospho-acceptor domain-containing protein, partial [Phototrophicaceae bacterium]|nr:histidine kinase dimerization/phospho-acceptor domain-containing protein [Phototrophicaceae bacterium]